MSTDIYLKLQKVKYSSLNDRQKENFNFMKVSAALADYGFNTVRLSDDFHGADFLAIHKSGDILKVQLKGRLVFDKKYSNKNIYMCFEQKDKGKNEGTWYLYHHDNLLKVLAQLPNLKKLSKLLDRKTGGYSFPHLSNDIKRCMAKCVLH